MLIFQAINGKKKIVKFSPADRHDGAGNAPVAQSRARRCRHCGQTADSVCAQRRCKCHRPCATAENAPAKTAAMASPACSTPEKKPPNAANARRTQCKRWNRTDRPATPNYAGSPAPRQTVPWPARSAGVCRHGAKTSPPHGTGCTRRQTAAADRRAADQCVAEKNSSYLLSNRTLSLAWIVRGSQQVDVVVGLERESIPCAVNPHPLGFTHHVFAIDQKPINYY